MNKGVEESSIAFVYEDVRIKDTNTPLEVGFQNYIFHPYYLNKSHPV